jgi:hypothetical protein
MSATCLKPATRPDASQEPIYRLALFSLIIGSKIRRWAFAQMRFLIAAPHFPGLLVASNTGKTGAVISTTLCFHS